MLFKLFLRSILWFLFSLKPSHKTMLADYSGGQNGSAGSNIGAEIEKGYNQDKVSPSVLRKSPIRVWES